MINSVAKYLLSNRVVLLTSMLLVCFVSQLPQSDAADPKGANAEDAALTVQVDLGKFAQSKVGELIIKAGANLVAEELEKDSEEAMEAVIGSLGFNPIEQEAKLLALISNIEEPIDGARIALQLKDTTGNLEGLLLAAPGYSSEKHNGKTIHSIDMDGQALFVGFHKPNAGNKMVFVSGSRRWIEASMKDGAESINRLNTELTLSDQQYIHVQMNALPEELEEEPPLSNIAQLIANASLSVGEDQDEMVARITLTANEDEKAVQLQQLAQGIVAMASLFKDEIMAELDDEDSGKEVMAVLNQIAVQRDEKRVTIETRISRAATIQFLRTQAGLPL